MSEPTFRYSISTYVGRKIWSSVLYLIDSCFVSFALVRFLFSEKIPKVFRYFGLLVVTSFLFEFALLFAYFASLLTFAKTTQDDTEKVSMVSC